MLSRLTFAALSVPDCGAESPGPAGTRREGENYRRSEGAATVHLLQTIVMAMVFAAAIPAGAEPWAAPGDPRLRSDLQLLSDTGLLSVPLTTWPLSWSDIDRGLVDVDEARLSTGQLLAFNRLQRRARFESASNEADLRIKAGAATNPRIVRSFEDTPREEGKVSAGISWRGERFALNLNASLVSNPFDGDDVRPDGTYVGMALGNWMLSAGWQERWWGPGRDGSLILSSNARPVPAIGIQRNVSEPFDGKWLGWIGPWTLTSFMGRLDDERVVTDALLFGLRVTFRPLENLEIGLSRTAQWCGDDRPCGFSAFTDLLIGNDNRGVNVDPEDEPGNQLGGFDIRWTLPRRIPVALYMQWIGEDSRQGGPEIGSWLRLIGAEHWGSIGDAEHRTHVEVSDTTCREGGFGFSDIKPNCGYEHSIYQGGYRYKGGPIGHGMDGDGLSYSLGSTLVQSAGHSWNLLVRYIEINRTGVPGVHHSLSATPQKLGDLQLTHSRVTSVGQFHFGFGLSELDDEITGESSSDVTAFVQWTSH